MSHGIPRVSQVEPPTEEAVLKERQKIERYKSLVDLVDDRIRNQSYNQETLAQITQLLNKNPEYYTIWNHRRRVLQALLSEKQDVNDVASELRDDLRFLVPLMLKFPKCYWIWKYRSWLLEQSTERLPASSARIIWKEELALVSKLLSRDGRNFHGWGYRRVVVEALESDALQVEGQDDEQSLVTSEIEYTKKMIYGNLSNFSAWHTRSKLIIRMLDEEHADDERRKATFDNELRLSHEALIDPYDQSLWFYHACLMVALSPNQAAKSMAPRLTERQRLTYLADEIEFVLEMKDEAEDCKWIYQSLIQLVLEYQKQAGQWPEKGSKDDVRTWMTELKKLDPLREGRWLDLDSVLQSRLR